MTHSDPAPTPGPPETGRRRPAAERAVRVAAFALPILAALSVAVAVWAHARAGRGGASDLATLDVVSRPVVDQRPAPAFSVGALSGPSALSLRQYEGRVVVVNLWASWCGPCRQEAPGLERVWKQYRATPVVFLGIDHADRRSDGAAFAREFGLTYPLAFDPNGEVARAFGAVGVPTTYVIAPNGWIAYRFLGRVRPTDLIRILNLMQPSS